MASQSKLIEELRARITELEARLAALEPSPGSISGQPGEVRVGGQVVRLKPLSPAQWVLALKEIPGFLLAYAVQESRGQDPEEALLERLVNTARQWVAACAMDPCDPAMLTIPEAQQVLLEVSRQNGLDAQLAEFFRQRLGEIARPGSQTLRGAPEPDARSN